MAKEPEITEKKRHPTQFKPGQSGNPAGRPKGAGISITTAIKRELEKKPAGVGTATYLELLVKRIMKKAIQDGDQQTIKQIWNYIDGMPQQNFGMDTDGKTAVGLIVLPAKQVVDYENMDTTTKADSSPS